MSSIRFLTAALVIGATSGLVTRADAQIGGLLKKARTSVAGAPALNPPAFDAVVLELDQARLGSVITGIRTQRAHTGPNGATVASLQQQASQAFTRRDEILTGKDQATIDFQAKQRAVSTCTRNFFDALNDQRQADMPRLIQKMGGYTGQGMQEIQAIAMQMGQRMAAGDTAGALKARDQIWAKMGVDQKADSAKAIAQCGAEPPPPAWLLQAEGLLKQGNASLAAARNLEEESREAGAQAAGLSARQYAMAIERIEAYVVARGKPGLPWKYSTTELAALSARMGDLQGLGFE